MRLGFTPCGFRSPACRHPACRLAAVRWTPFADEKGYVTNLRACPDGTPITADFVIGAYHQVVQIEKVVPDVQARPASPPDLPPQTRLDRSPPDHRLRRLAVSRWIESQTGWSIRKFVRTARRYRTIEIQAGAHTITAADPLPGDLRQALEMITRARPLAHSYEAARQALADGAPGFRWFGRFWGWLLGRCWAGGGVPMPG